LVAAATAASVPLWPTAASAQDWTARKDHEVVISSGDTCTIQLEAALDDDTDHASAWMGVSGPGDCSAHQQSMHLFVTTTSGQDTFASSFGDGSVQR
jgi:hypothetical protein